jgi:hypothetical protein
VARGQAKFGEEAVNVLTDTRLLASQGAPPI